MRKFQKIFFAVMALLCLLAATAFASDSPTGKQGQYQVSQSSVITDDVGIITSQQAIVTPQATDSSIAKVDDSVTPGITTGAFALVTPRTSSLTAASASPPSAALNLVVSAKKITSLASTEVPGIVAEPSSTIS